PPPSPPRTRSPRGADHSDRRPVPPPRSEAPWAQTARDRPGRDRERSRSGCTAAIPRPPPASGSRRWQGLGKRRGKQTTGGGGATGTMRESRRPLAVGAGEHRLQQDIDARGGVVELGVLRLVVRDAVSARSEDHGGGRHPRDVVRVVARLAQDVPMRHAELLPPLADDAHAAGGESLIAELPLPPDAPLPPCPP